MQGMTWLREMWQLWRAYRQSGRDLKASLETLDADIERRAMRAADEVLMEEYARCNVDLGGGDIAFIQNPLEFWEAYVECRGFTGKATAAEMARARRHVDYLRRTESNAPQK